MNKPSPEDIPDVLNKLYAKSLDGIPKISKPVTILADDYLRRHTSTNKAAKALIRNQIIKCTTSGFITGFGGIVTLPVTIPADISSVLYVQMRMIAALAYMGGYELDSDQTQTLVYACLAGVSVNGFIKHFGVQFGNKFANACIKKIPGKALNAINKKIGFRFITKFGEKGLINLGKMIPIVGAAINGGFDLGETKIIATRAYKWFIKNDFTNQNESKDKDIIDVTPSDD